ncbi:MAG: NAD(P)H-dependent oxidoreductase [Bacteroidaceae bacterium]|nr:NAD(P)H-dependent oxidoreductase [Bacteroidaceae bacterium]
MGACGSSNKQGSSNDLGEQYKINFSEESVNPKPNKKVLVISASPRRGGNTDLLSDEFIRGAQEMGAQVEKVFLGDYDIKFYTEPETEPGQPIQWPQDDAQMITDKMVDADVIVLASPVYFMNIDGQMKALIDRTFSRFMEIKDKEFFYITACADPIDSTAMRAIDGFRGFVMCLPNPTERGMVKAIGMGRKGGVKGSQFMTQAYELGKKV